MEGLFNRSWFLDCILLSVGRFPGSEIFTNVPQVDKPIFLKTETFFSPPDLYKKFAGTDAKD